MTKMVLVVDDDPDVRQFNTTVAEECGYTVHEASNGEEGLEKIRQERPDLLLLDVLMPRQSGIRLYRELKTDKALQGIAVLLLSGIAKKTFLRSQKAPETQPGECSWLCGGSCHRQPDIFLRRGLEE